MSTPRRRIIQTSFLPPEGPQQRTLPVEGGPSLMERGVILTPEAYRSARGARPPPPPPAPIRPIRRLTEYGAVTEGGPAPIPLPGFVPASNLPPPPPPQPVLMERAPVAPVSNPFTLPPGADAAWHLPFPLRPYQEETVRRLLAQRHGTGILATGLGKTLIGIALILKLRVPAVVIVPTKVLLTQWQMEMARAGITAGMWYGDEKRPGYVLLSTYQSLYTDPALISRYPLIIFDEGDLATAQDFSALIHESDRHPYAFVLTATPPRDVARQRVLEQHLPIVMEITSAQGIESGHLVPLRIEGAPVSLTGQEATDYDRMTEIIRKSAHALGTSDPARIAHIASMGDSDMRTYAYAYLKAVAERKRILSTAKEKPVRLVDIVRSLPRQRILVFSESVNGIDTACTALTTAGFPCRVISGATNPQARRDILENWGKTFYILGSVKVLERGFNVPDVSVAIFLASGVGRTQLTQRIGRILRPAPGKRSATVYVIYARDTIEDRILPALEHLTNQEAADGDGE